MSTSMTMDKSTVPLRHASMPGDVKLPKRYGRTDQDLMTKRKGSSEQEREGSIPERLGDLSQALLWIKQELILLRQHDILLKRQFCDIQETIKSLYKSKTRIYGRNNTNSTSSLHSCSSIDFTLENYSVREASSVTALYSDDEEDDINENQFRPRTSSMKTTRDLAALARRRGSKELI